VTDEYYETPLPSYGSQPQYQIPVPEDHHWKREYTRIDFENKSFNYLKKKLERLDIPQEKIDDLVDELMIIVNNAGKMKIKIYEINWLIDEFDTLWDNFCIYNLRNSRWIDELNHVRRYALYVLLQEYHKSIDGWQGDNVLRSHSIVEQSHAYNVKQENVQQKRGFFGKKPKRQPPAVQGYDLSQQRR